MSSSKRKRRDPSAYVNQLHVHGGSGVVIGGGKARPGKEQEEDGAARPTPHNLPPRRLFVGRGQEIERIDEALRRDGRTSITHASLWGLGGVGKTALALEYAHCALERGAYPGGVWWLLAEGHPLDAMVRLEASLRRYAPALVAGVRPDAPAQEIAEAARLALEAQSRPSLLVLDNVSEPGFAKLVPGNQVRVLMTTRERRLGLGRATELDVLSEDDARKLAIDLAGNATVSEVETEALGCVVVDVLGGLAVAVEVGARAVREWAGGWVAYEKHLRRQMDAALDAPADRSEHYPRGVFAALDLSIDRCGERARRLLEGAAVFAPEAVPLAWAFAVAALDPESIEAQRALGELDGLRLVKVDRVAGQVSIHRLVHKRARDRAEPEAWLGASARAAEHMARWIEAAVGPTREQMEEVDARRAHIEAALAAAEGAGSMLEWSGIADRLATHLHHRGEYGEARPLFERALDIKEKSLGPTHRTVATSLSNLASVLQDLGEAAKARPLLERALDIQEKSLGPTNPTVAISLSNLAVVLQDLGEAAKARPLLERALDIEEKSLGPTPPSVAISLSNLASVLQDLGEAAKARPLLERALDIEEKSLGPTHPTVAISLSNLASVLQDLGEAAKARPLLERALDIQEKSLGPTHPSVAIRLSNLAVVLQDLGEAAKARPLLERALSIAERALGPTHPNVAIIRSNLARLLSQMEQR